MKPPAHAPEFLASCGWKDAEILPLAGDASFRRYFRVVNGDRSAVLMDAPPPHEDPRPFIAVAEWLASVGLSAPPILARDLERGLLLLGDFGDWRLREFLDEDPRRELGLYELATDVLIHLHLHPPMPGLKPHGLDQWLEELKLFIDWYCPAVGAEVDKQGYLAAWTEVLEPVAADGLGPVTVLRDYHAENVMLVDGREGVERFGLLDFQDALAGHPAYDLVSLLQDARVTVPVDLEAELFAIYCAEVAAREPAFDREAFAAAYADFGAQRNTRLLGLWLRLLKRDGKPHYVQNIPRTWGYLARNLRATALGDLAAWYERHFPVDLRTGRLPG